MSFEQVRKDWITLGGEDPLWAVLVAEGKRGGRWDTDAFLQLGRDDVASARKQLSALGLPATWDRVLDFGCGTGRLSQALAEHAAEVVGVDVSPPMLDKARSFDRSSGRVTFVLNQHPDLRAFPDASFDLVFTERVLQHLPPEALETYLTEFLRVLRPGGVAWVHCTTRPTWSFRGFVWRAAPAPVIRWAQRRLLGYPAPMRMTGVSEKKVAELVAMHGGAVVDAVAVAEPESHWQARRYVIRRGHATG
ncbi:class I SAM-dependent methyltransferase [Blastococcus goldschmidtiae]|uniref:Class I SAM-dependent methyltransferase n=1 Tax=Blastococcus goldschmidtiae TaxID=3075546 RepID=A0ABU2K575_9ACTN|nr:class I SAM-dependent methyltransferase [Blastococcus sp. DSM 46792]MDT0275336.1 class I SAM-dependent methyltransferase [Blastococcus sp. DSM 46792]